MLCLLMCELDEVVFWWHVLLAFISGVDNVMAFLAKSGFLDTSSGEVRVAARNCIVAVYKRIGDAVRPYLKDLRAKQVRNFRVLLLLSDSGFTRF